MSRAIPANIYLFRVTNRNKRIRCEICPKLTVRTLELVFTVNFEHIFLTFSNVEFEQVNVYWHRTVNKTPFKKIITIGQLCCHKSIDDCYDS